MSRVKDSYSKVPPPDLQQLVEDHGGYDRITPGAWEKWDRDMAEWKANLRAGVHYDTK